MRTSIIRLCVGTAISLTLTCLTGLILHNLSFSLLPNPRGYHPKNLDQSRYLGIASQTYVISLARRSDRRQDMEKLRAALGLQWTYVEAIDAQHPMVGKILERVSEQRERQVSWGADLDRTSLPGTIVEFRWPTEIDALASSTGPLDLSRFEKLVASGSSVASKTSSISATSPQNITNLRPPRFPLVCATQDNDVAAYNTTLPEYSILSPEKIACWYSHLAVIRQVADRKGPDEGGAAVILEDDIDMEWDIRDRLGAVWDLLPTQWDIVFLGHCWSNESYYPALQPPQPEPFSLSYSNSPVSNQTHLHPSNGPKCTHAYVLSPTGARRILLHLLYPPFAYSRAIDQALMWLVSSGRLRSFSVVPSVVVQRKVVGSDVVPAKGVGTEKGGGRGSDWRESLVNGVFQT